MKNVIYSSLLISSFFCHAAFATGVDDLNDDLECRGVAAHAIANNYKVEWTKLNPKSEEDQKRGSRIYTVLFDEIEDKKLVHQIRLTEKENNTDKLYLDQYERLQNSLKVGWDNFVADGLK